MNYHPSSIRHIHLLQTIPGVFMLRFLKLVICGLVGLLPAVAQADIIRYELQVAGTLPGNAAGKTASVAGNGSTVQLDLFMLVQGDNGTMDETLKQSYGYIQSSNGGLQVDLAGTIPTGPFRDNPAGINAGTPFDMNGDGDTDIGDTGTSSGYYTLGVGLGDYGFGSSLGFRDGFVSAASLGLTGNDFAYAKIMSITATVDDLSILNGESTLISFLPRTGGNYHLTRADGANFNSNGTANIAVGSGVTISTATAVPEPGTLALGGMLIAGLASWKLRRKQA
jgi:hypothetical protein